MTGDLQGRDSVKPHYLLLDGLRGVAAMVVVWYHVFEGFATSPLDQKFNHGYLAVDFFFVLSGFVIGHAYDDRWKKSLTVKDFLRRRIVRLHPMVVIGVLLGAASFLLQGSVKWDGTAVPLTMVLLSMLMHLFMIPALPGTGVEVRGNGEMFPLNGPMWSLFFEYIGSVLYALILRKLPTKVLAVLVALFGLGLAYFALGDCSGFCNIAVGWSLSDYNFIGGLLRLLFSFSMGLLLSRLFRVRRPVRVTGAFWICSAAIVLSLSVPYIGDANGVSTVGGVGGVGAVGVGDWLNGLYDSFCVLVVFPLLVWIGASGSASGNMSSKFCKWLGDISYPLYITHYPVMYLFYSYVWSGGRTFGQVWPIAVSIFFGSIALAYLFFRFYDRPLRKFLSRF